MPHPAAAIEYATILPRRLDGYPSPPIALRGAGQAQPYQPVPSLAIPIAVIMLVVAGVVYVATRTSDVPSRRPRRLRATR